MFKITYKSPDGTVTATVKWEDGKLTRHTHTDYFIAQIEEEKVARQIANSMKEFGGWVGDQKWIGGLLVKSDVLLGRLLYWQHIGLDKSTLSNEQAAALAEEIIREQGVGNVKTKACTIKYEHIMAFHPLAPSLSKEIGDIAQKAPTVISTHGSGGSRCSCNEWEYRTKVGEWYENWIPLKTRESCTYKNCLREKSRYTNEVVPPVLAQLLYLIEEGKQIKQVSHIKSGSYDIGGMITRNKRGSSQKTRVYNLGQ